MEGMYFTSGLECVRAKNSTMEKFYNMNLWSMGFVLWFGELQFQYKLNFSLGPKVKTKRKGSRKASKAKTNVFDRLALGGSGQWVFVTNTNRGGEIPLLPSSQPILSIRNRNKLKTYKHKHK